MSSCFSGLMNLLFPEALKTLASHSTHRISISRLPKGENCAPDKVPPLLTPGLGSLEREGQGSTQVPRLHFPELRGAGDWTRGRGALQTGGRALPGLGQEVGGWPSPWFLVVGHRELGE